MAQTYQCDICNTVAGDFMVTYINDGRVISVGVECLPLWAIGIAAGWAEALIDQGAEVPEWAPVVIDAHRQLAALEGDGPDSPPQAPGGDAAPVGADDGPGGAAGRTDTDGAGPDPVGEDTEAGQASHVDR